MEDGKERKLLIQQPHPSPSDSGTGKGFGARSWRFPYPRYLGLLACKSGTQESWLHISTFKPPHTSQGIEGSSGAARDAVLSLESAHFPAGGLGWGCQPCPPLPRSPASSLVNHPVWGAPVFPPYSRGDLLSYGGGLLTFPPESLTAQSLPGNSQVQLGTPVFLFFIFIF